MSLPRRSALLIVAAVAAAGFSVVAAPAPDHDPRTDTSWGRLGPPAPDLGGDLGVLVPEVPPVSSPTTPSSPGAAVGHHHNKKKSGHQHARGRARG